jgi:hypothetical protein
MRRKGRAKEEATFRAFLADDVRSYETAQGVTLSTVRRAPRQGPRNTQAGQYTKLAQGGKKMRGKRYNFTSVGRAPLCGVASSKPIAVVRGYRTILLLGVPFLANTLPNSICDLLYTL